MSHLLFELHLFNLVLIVFLIIYVPKRFIKLITNASTMRIATTISACVSILKWCCDIDKKGLEEVQRTVIKMTLTCGNILSSNTSTQFCLFLTTVMILNLFPRVKIFYSCLSKPPKRKQTLFRKQACNFSSSVICSRESK